MIPPRKAPTRTLHDATRRAVASWVRHPLVRTGVTDPEGLRVGASVALEPLEAVVGPLDQYGVSWLLTTALGARAWPTPEAGDYPTPEWADRPEARVAGAALLAVVTTAARTLRDNGVKLDPASLTDRLVLAQLLALSPPWDAGVEAVVEGLNLGAVRQIREDGRAVIADQHGGHREDNAASGLARDLRGTIRSYSEREGLHDTELRALLAERPDLTADDILSNPPDWALDLDRRGLQRALSRLRGRTATRR